MPGPLLSHLSTSAGSDTSSWVDQQRVGNNTGHFFLEYSIIYDTEYIYISIYLYICIYIYTRNTSWWSSKSRLVATSISCIITMSYNRWVFTKTQEQIQRWSLARLIPNMDTVNDGLPALPAITYTHTKAWWNRCKLSSSGMLYLPCQTGWSWIFSNFLFIMGLMLLYVWSFLDMCKRKFIDLAWCMYIYIISNHIMHNNIYIYIYIYICMYYSSCLFQSYS